MSANIIYPNINDAGGDQIRQIKSYLYQLAEQLNYALSQTGDGGAMNIAVSSKGKSAGGSSAAAAVPNFEEIKALIIKSADLVEVFSDEISQRLSGRYVAKSEYGTFKQETENELAATSNGVSMNINSIQQLQAADEQTALNVSMLMETNAYFRAGQLEADVYGIEIGRMTEIGGELVFSRYARFLPNRLSFFDSNNTELAYFSDYKLHVNGIETNDLKIGGYRLDDSDGLMFLWEG